MIGWPTDEESELGDGVRPLLEKHCDSSAIRSSQVGTSRGGVVEAAWRNLVEQIGLPGLAIAEQFGGSGADVGALASAALEIGRRAAPVPWLSSVLAASILAAAGASAEKELADVLSGTPVALAFPLDGSPSELTVGPNCLTGTARHVLDGCAAEFFIAVADDQFFVIDAASATVTPLATLDLTRTQATVSFAASSAKRLDMFDAAATIAASRQLAAVLVAAEQVGGARWCLETATAHAKVREQFGVPIGSFQAVKHLLADLLVATELAQCLLADAVSALRPESGQIPEVISAAVHTAAIACAEMGATVSAGAIQVLGGVGFTWEHDVHFYFRRARASAQLTGNPSSHKEPLAGLLLSHGRIRTSRDHTDPTVVEFAARAADWLSTNTAPVTMRDVESEAEHIAAAKAFQCGLFDAGLAGITWPREFGGQGLSSDHDLAFADAARGREIFTDLFGIGLGMCGPVLMALGSEDQKAQLAPMLRGEKLWCQLFSEPGSGSDLASLRTKAVRQEDGSWVVDGDKVWTTYAHQSDFGLMLARTDPDVAKHRGISMFIVDMHADGVTASPLRQITGDSEFNEVRLSNVRLLADAIVGAPGDGWKAALTMLMNERVTLGRNPLAMSSPVHADAARALVRDRGLHRDPVVRQRLAEVWCAQRSLELLGNVIAASVRSGEDPGPFASIGKLGAGQLAVRTAAFAADVAGADAVAWDPAEDQGGLWSYGMLFAPALAIAGGTDQIQKSIIGERILGLPR